MENAVSTPTSANSRCAAEPSSFQCISFTETHLFPRDPFSPSSSPAQRLIQVLPAKRKFLAACNGVRDEIDHRLVKGEALPKATVRAPCDRDFAAAS